MPTAFSLWLRKCGTNNFLENDSFSSIFANIKCKTKWRHRNLKWVYIIGDTDKVINKRI
jgi:hypothetical protein